MYNTICNVFICAVLFQLLHKSVDMVEKRLTGSSGILTLKCKDFQTLKLEIPTADDCLNIAASVESLSNIGLITVGLLYSKSDAR